MSGFTNINNSHISDIANKLGMRQGRDQRSYSPCPCCNETQRGSTDKRLPVGASDNGRGWQCFKCNETGNLSDLVCLTIIGQRYQQAPPALQQEVRKWIDDNGFGAQAPKKLWSGVIGIRDTIPARYRQPEPEEQQAEEKTKEYPSGNFAWVENGWREYKANLTSEKGKPVLDYLINERKLANSVIQSADLGVYWDNSGKPWLTIPLKEADGSVVNIRFRSVPPHKKTYRVCPQRPLPLYGCHSLTGSDYVVIVEGELDVLAAKSYGFNNIVSGTAGAKANWKEEWLDAIEHYSSFVLWYDNDQAGHEGRLKLAQKLGIYRAFYVQSTYKDIGEELQAGVPQAEIQQKLLDLKSFVQCSLKKAADYAQEIEELIKNPVTLKGIPTGSQRLDATIGGIRAGLWVVTGDTGHGKTTWATWLLWKQAHVGTPVMMTSFEQRPIGTVQKLLRAEVGGDFTKSSEQSRQMALMKLSSLPLYIMDHYGDINADKVIETIRFASRRHGVKIALVDHLGFLTRDVSDSQERQAIEQVVRKLATIAVQDNITIVLICHPNNTSVYQQRRVRISDLKGASAIRQDAHVGIVVERGAVTAQVANPTTKIHIDKVRSEFGKAGSNCVLAFDPLACVYADKWEDTPFFKSGKTIMVPQ